VVIFTDRADVAELVDALVSGTSEVTLVEVQVLSSAPNEKTEHFARFFRSLKKNVYGIMTLRNERLGGLIQT
jgi:hypothetical protein